MKVLFVFYVPSGGMDTINRLRCQELRNYGIEASCLYYFWGAGMQNRADFPIYITNDDAEIKQILDAGGYDVIVVTTDHESFPRFRQLGYTGKLVLEIQGYGPQEVARSKLTEAVPYVNAYASALMNPSTPHITALFQELFPHIPCYIIPNSINSETFTYRQTTKLSNPVIAWLGRIDDNKNWREFLYIGHQLTHFVPDLQLWMFEDPNLGDPDQRQQFLKVVDDLQLGSRLTMHANIPNHEMQYYYSSIGDSGGFMCSTSKVEGGPLSVLEAMSCRCPILASNSDGVTITIKHNVTGKNYNLGNVHQAVSEGLNLMQDVELRESIRDAAQHLVKTEFTPYRYSVSFMDMLNNI
ncbi:glycosyltransferase family 4 protein [Paenibacillus favisporus]|uniref:glycosyltransferase family 4 protein n=1 Tax=Paenibacillus favisporus TaxID=221028 RepID=UPI0013CFF8E4|nr:glycosyltransferase [Paenibacillus favisporus]